jgi:hypothetical protein
MKWPRAVLGLKQNNGAADHSNMGSLAVICGLVSGLALMAIQVRHMGWKASFLDPELPRSRGS